MLANSGARPGCRGTGVNRVGGWEVRAIAPAGRAAGRGPPGRALGLAMRFFDPGPVTRPGVRAPGYDGGLTSTGWSCVSVAVSSVLGRSFELISWSMHVSLPR